MAFRTQNLGKGAMYVDRLTKASVRSLLAGAVKSVVVLDELDAGQKKWLLTLNRKGVTVNEANFFAGHLKNKEGESIYLASRRLAFEMSISSAGEVVDAHPLLQSINARYKRNTVLLSLAKELALAIEPAVIRMQVAMALAYPAVPSLWLVEPKYFSGDLLKSRLPGVNLNFYGDAQPKLLFWFKKLINVYLYHFVRLFRFRVGWEQAETTGAAPSVLMVQEDNIRVDRTLRGQPHWLDLTEPASKFTTYISDLKSLCFVSEDLRATPKSTLSLVGALITCKSWFRRGRSKVLNQLSENRLKVFRAAIMECRSPQKAAALIHVYQLLMNAERIGALAIFLNTKVFVTLELNGDAMQLVAEDLSIKTIAVQYSNLGFLAPCMLSTADYYVLFSAMYERVFATHNISPANWYVAGYTYDCVAEMVRTKALARREMLLRSGADFVICYFDESVQTGKWGLVSATDHLNEIHVLARAVLEDRSLGVVTKSQFMSNSPSRLYPNDKLIQRAIATGRFLELMDGKHRNDIYPSEAALIANICISHKFGATAALEAALAGVRTILLDHYSCRTLWDDIYAKANVEYTSMDKAMLAINDYRLDRSRDNSLGDWNPILHHFDSFRDGRAAGRLKELVDQLILEKTI